MSNKHFKIEQVYPKIFLFKFKDDYQMAMHFLRYQEFYESPNPKFRNHAFKLLDFMEWYVKKDHQRVFSYPNDWAGYNFPGNNIKRVISAGIPDPNHYDAAMQEAYQQCIELAQSEDFYIIGSAAGDKFTLRHEIAHGLYYLDRTYKKEMNNLIKEIPNSAIKQMNEVLKKMGYTSAVFKDEIQAYLSTGFEDNDDIFHSDIAQYADKFVDAFKKYYKK